MLIEVLRRLSQMVLILVALSVGLFGLLSAMPGDPVDLLITSNPSVRPEDVARLKQLRGLDQPLPVRYLRWVWGHHEARRAPTVRPAAAVSVVVGDEPVSTTVDLGPLLDDQDERWGYDELVASLERRAPALAGVARIAAEAEDSDEERTAAAASAVRRQDASVYAEVASELGVAAVGRLEVRSLDPDVEVDGHRLNTVVRAPGVRRSFFAVGDPDGHETVGSFLVQATKKATAAEDSTANGAPEEDVPAAPLEAALRWHVGPVPPALADDDGEVELDLRERLVGLDDESRARAQIELASGSPGSIDEQGVYRGRFTDPGRSAVVFEVSLDGRRARGAFSVDHGPIIDRARFHRGFAFALVGDREALGFSNTYKRPVWDLLFGAEVICGDRQVGHGETCDDGGRVDGDGCSSGCVDESLGLWERLDAWGAGVLLGSGRVMNTVTLMLPALLLSLFIALPLGVLAATRQYSWADYVINLLAFVGISMPIYWLGIMALVVMAEGLHWLPAGGMQTPGLRGGFFDVAADRATYAVLPTLVLSCWYTGRWLRYMRSSMLEVLPLDYVRTARAKGLRERAVVLKHALKNALLPVITVLALSVPSLFGGALLTEQVFSWPGIGRLQFDAVMANDSYLAIVVFLISAALLMLGNLAADVLYRVVDPRIRRM